MFQIAAAALALASGLRAQPKSEPKTHDYTRRGWGHDYCIMTVIDDGQRLKASGWGSGIGVGDFLLLQNGMASSRYRVDAIRYMRDPTDQWFADLAFAPRSTAA